MFRDFPWRGTGRDCAALLCVTTVLTVLSFWLNPKSPAWSWRQPAVNEVNLRDVKEWPRAPLWIDARSTESYEKQHIPGAILLNEDSWDQFLPGLLSAWQPSDKIVVYCDSQACDASQSVAARLQRELKLNEIYVLEGGWKTWQEFHQ